MPFWASLIFGLAAGLAILALVIFISVRPYVAAKPPKSRLADPSGNVDHYNDVSGGGPPGGFGSG